MAELEISRSAKSIFITSFLQILLIIIFGLTLSIVLKLFYKYISTNYRVFEPKDYRGNLNSIPRQYRFVEIKYNDLEQVETERFFTFLGDYICVKYSNEKCISHSTLLVYNIFLSIFALIGVLLLMSADAYEHNLAELSQSINVQTIRNYGGLLIFSSLISAVIKSIYDFAYLGLD